MRKMTDALRRLAIASGRPLRIMEVCGTHTMAVFKHGIKDMLPEGVTLVSGPGCPVCVTSVKDVDTAIEISKRNDVVFATFGDMMKVPGSEKTLSEARAEGADVRVVYSPLDALKMAREEPKKKVVFFAVGFETTAPSVAATLFEAETMGIGNFYVHSVHKLIPPALRALLYAPGVRIDGFLLPGHVGTVIGRRPFEFISDEYGVPAVIAGFEASDILEALLMLLGMTASKRAGVEIQYRRAVREEGNPKAVEMINERFGTADSMWRGIGVIPKSALRPRDSSRDAASVMGIELKERPEPKGCRCGEVLRGLRAPSECPLFARGCTPEKPVGACMVSLEGSCAVHYRFGGAGRG